MSEQDLIYFLKIISEDIHWIRRDIARLARGSYLQDLEKIANTPVRREIWRLCNGDFRTEEIAKKVDISARAVQYFIQDAEKKGLIITPKRGYPKRPDNFDEIPTEWKPYKKSEAQVNANVETGGSPDE